jgi:hypothetical protein
MEISVPAGTSCAIASTGTRSRQTRITESYRFAFGEAESVGIHHGSVGINNRDANSFIP